MAEIQITMQDVEASGKSVKIINFAGQLDETNVDEEVKKIYEVIDGADEPNLLLDFSGLTYMNSKSIGYVTDWYSRTAAKNGKIVIAKPQSNILDILKVVGITQIINIHDDIEKAKADFGDAEVSVIPVPTASAPAPAQPEATTPPANTPVPPTA